MYEEMLMSVDNVGESKKGQKLTNVILEWSLKDNCKFMENLTIHIFDIKRLLLLQKTKINRDTIIIES